MFQSHRWPGNVRELSNAVQRFLVTPERALGFPSANEVQSSSVPSAPLSPIAPLRIARRDANDAFERGYVTQILSRTNGNVTRAAAIAEVSRQIVQKLMRKHDLG
jgi:DNA-binding NtrC family response regulator